MYEQSSSSRHGSSRPSIPISSTASAQNIPYRTSPRSISSRDYDVPPPLPPPRILPGMIAQHRPNIRGNTHGKGSLADSGVGSVSPASSLARGNWERPPHLVRRESDSRRGSFPAIWSPTGSDSYDMKPHGRPEHSYAYDFKDEGYSSLSGSSLIHSRLVIHSWFQIPLQCLSKAQILRRKRLGVCRKKLRSYRKQPR